VLDAAPSNPQTWNKYSYGLNNPLRYVDRDGRWPTSVHNDIIDKSFPAFTWAQKNILKEESVKMDAIENQSAEKSFMHGMSDGLRHQSPGAASLAAYNFVWMEVNLAINAQVKAALTDWQANFIPTNEALRHLGRAIHTVTDMTDPIHSGFMPWNPWEAPSVIGHGLFELLYSPYADHSQALARHNAMIVEATFWWAFEKKLANEQKKDKK